MNHDERMDEIGARLERAVAADLREEAEVSTESHGWRARLASRRARIFGGLAVAVAIAAPSAAWAAGAFTSAQQEAASLPATSTIFAGTDPTCTVVRPGAEYRCILARPPKALPYLGLPDRQESWLFGMSPAQDKEFLKIANGTDPAAYRAFVADVRAYRADLDQRLLTRWGVAPATIARWVAAMRDLQTATDVREGHFTGHTMQTQDSEDRTNGACQATNAAGTIWQCYLGQAAVRARVLRPEVLGGKGLGGPTDDL